MRLIIYEYALVVLIAVEGLVVVKVSDMRSLSKCMTFILHANATSYPTSRARPSARCVDHFPQTALAHLERCRFDELMTAQCQYDT